MTSSRKTYSSKSIAPLSESEKLRQDVEELENALILHSRYQTQADNSVRGLIRKEIGGSHWEYGADGKLTTYQSKRDLKIQQQSETAMKVRKSSISQQEKKDSLSRKDSQGRTPRNHAVEDNKEMQRSRSSSRHSKKEKQKSAIPYSDVHYKQDRSRMDTDLSLKVVSSKDRKPYNNIDTNINFQKAVENTRLHNKEDIGNRSKKLEFTPTSTTEKNEKALVKPIPQTTDSKSTTHHSARKKDMSRPHKGDHVMLAAQSVRTLDADSGGRTPVSSVEISYTYTTPGKGVYDKPSYTYEKTLEFLLSQFKDSRLPDHTAREKGKTRNVSNDHRKDSKDHSRRHTTDGQHLSNKAGVASQGVSYLESRTWQSAIKDSIPSEKFHQYFEESPQTHSAPGSWKSDRSSLSPSSGEFKRNKHGEFQVDFSGLYYYQPLQNQAWKTSTTGNGSTAAGPETQSAQTHQDHYSIPELANEVETLPHNRGSSVQSHPFNSQQKLSKVFTSVQSKVSQDDVYSLNLPPDNVPKTSTDMVSKPECDPHVKDWLETLDLQCVDRYIKLFSEHQMDMASVKLLTSGALRDMGINALGPIMKIIKGVQILCREHPEHQSTGKEAADQLVEPILLDLNRTKSSLENNSVPGLSNPEEDVNSKSSEFHLPIEASSDHHGSLHKGQQDRPKGLAMTDRPKGLAMTDRPQFKALEAKEDIDIAASASHPESEKPERTQFKKKSSKIKAKKSGSTVTGKPPMANKIGDDGIAAAAKKYSVKRQEQIRKLETEEKNVTVRKQVRDELTYKHLLRRSSSLERKSRSSSGLSRSSSFNCVGITTSDEPTNNGDAHQTNSHRSQKSSAEKGPLENYAADDIDIPAESLSENEERRQDTHSPLDDWSLGNIWALKKQLNDIELKLAYKEGELQLRHSQSPQTSWSQDDTGHIERGRLLLDLDENKDLSPGAAHQLSSQENRQETLLYSQSGSSPGSSAHAKDASVLAKEKQVLLSKEVTGAMPIKEPSPSAAITAKMSVTGHSVAIKGNTVHRDYSGHLKAHTKARPDIAATGFHIEDLKKVELDKNEVFFSEKDIVGDGAYSQVFKGTCKGTAVAVKRLKSPLQPVDKNYFAAEVSLLQKIHHPNVVTLLGVFNIWKVPHIVLELMPGGNLHTLLHVNSGCSFESDQFYQVARDISSGVHYLHHQQPPILHLDLNSRNVLLGHDFHAKIADFGFSKLKHEADTRLPKTNKSRQVAGGLPSWMAPELLSAGEVTAKADVYSFAIVLWEMVTRKLPYEGCSVYQVLEQVRTNKRPAIPDHCPPELSRLVQKCWEQNPAARPGFKEILKSLEQLSISQHWRPPDSPLAGDKEHQDNLTRVKQLTSRATFEQEAKATTVSKVNDELADRSGNTEDSTKLELKSFSSESDSESVVSTVDKLDCSNAVNETNNVLLCSDEFTSMHNASLQKPPLQTYPDHSSPCNSKNDISTIFRKKPSPKSSTLPCQETSKSADYLKSSQYLGDKLLPLRHSMDKPQVPTSLSLHALSPISSQSMLNSHTSDRTLHELLDRYSNKIRGSTGMSLKSQSSSEFIQKLSVESTNVQEDHISTDLHYNQIPATNTDSGIIAKDSLGTSLQIIAQKNAASKPLSAHPRRSVHHGQPYPSSFYEDRLSASNKGNKAKSLLVKNHADVEPLADDFDKVDFKLPSESLTDSTAVLSLESKVKTPRGSETVWMPESPKITKPDSQSVVGTKIKADHDAGVKNTDVESQCMSSELSPSGSHTDPEETKASDTKEIKPGVHFEASFPRDSQMALCHVSDLNDMTEHMYSDNDLISPLSVITGLTKEQKMETLNRTDSQCAVTQNSDDWPFKGKLPHARDRQLPSLNSEGFSVDSDDSSSLDSISEDSLILDAAHIEAEKWTTLTKGKTLSESGEDVILPKSDHHVRRTSSPKPQPTKSSKYSPIKVVPTSPIRVSVLHNVQESFFLSHQSNDAHSFQFDDQQRHSLEGNSRLTDYIECKGSVSTVSHGRLLNKDLGKSSLGTTSVSVFNLPQSESTHKPIKSVATLPQAHSSTSVVQSGHVNNLATTHATSPSVVPPAPALDMVQLPPPYGSLVTRGHPSSPDRHGHSNLKHPQENSHLPKRHEASQADQQVKRDSYVNNEHAVRFSLEASALLMQKGQLRSVKTRETPPLTGALKEEDEGPTFSVANILKKAIIDRRFAMGSTHDSADFTPNASWSMQDED